MEALFGQPVDPKATVRKWKSGLRSEQRVLDRQIRREWRKRASHAAAQPISVPAARSLRLGACVLFAEIQREEDKVKKSIKEAAKRGDTSTCKMLAKEVVRSRKAVNRLHTSKAQMNSVMMRF